MKMYSLAIFLHSAFGFWPVFTQILQLLLLLLLADWLADWS